MQKICSVNELKGHFYVQTIFHTGTYPPGTGRICFIYKERRSTALCSPARLHCPRTRCLPAPPPSHVPLRPTHCPTGPSAHLRKHDLSMKGTPAHIQVGEGQPAALLNVRINGMPRSVRSINAGLLFFFFLSNTTLPRSQKRSAFFFSFCFVLPM